MSTTETRAPLAVAQAAADRICEDLRPGVDVEWVVVAGSIRRVRADVGDIELVAVPIIRTEPDGMFETSSVNRLTERVDYLISTGALRSHPTDPKRGQRYSKLIDGPTGLQIDLFSATASTFGLIYLIRTGPRDYSQRFVTDLRRRALHVTGGELHRGSLGCGSSPCEVVPTPAERDVYEAAGWPFVQPWMRA